MFTFGVDTKLVKFPSIRLNKSVNNAAFDSTRKRIYNIFYEYPWLGWLLWKFIKYIFHFVILFLSSMLTGTINCWPIFYFVLFFYFSTSSRYEFRREERKSSVGWDCSSSSSSEIAELGEWWEIDLFPGGLPVRESVSYFIIEIFLRPRSVGSCAFSHSAAKSVLRSTLCSSSLLL